MVEIRRSFWIVTGIFLVALIGYYWARTSVFIQLIYLCLLLVVVSFFWTLFSTRGILVRRSAREFKQELGSIFEESFEIINQYSWMRPWIEIIDKSTLPGPGGARVLSWVGKRKSRSYSAYTQLNQRGQFLLGPTVLYSGDPFGIFASRSVFNSARTLLVLPYIFKLEQFPFPPGLLPGGKAQHQKTLEITPYAAGVREYSPGDSLNRIHWPTTARRNQLMVKEFEQDPQADLWLFVDANQVRRHFLDRSQDKEDRSGGIWFWKKKKEYVLPNDTFEYAVSICASIANLCIKQDKSVGFGISAQKHIIQYPDRGERQLGKILETLALAEPIGKLSIFSLVTSEIQNIARGSTVVVITSSNDREIISSADLILRRGMKPVIVLIDPCTFGAENGCNLDGLLSELYSKQLPVSIVRRGDELKEIIESSFKDQYHFKPKYI